jgi:hypothetical protein
MRARLPHTLFRARSRTPALLRHKNRTRPAVRCRARSNRPQSCYARVTALAPPSRGRGKRLLLSSARKAGVGQFRRSGPRTFFG